MAALPSDRVYQGFWTDYSRGPVLGATITITNAASNLVIALLSLLVAFTGGHIWDLVTLIHYGFSTKIPSRLRPAWYHQHLFLARNLSSPGTFALDMLRLSWRWRRQGPWARLAPLTVVAFLCSAGFLAAGIFVSLAVTGTDIQVLVASDTCGFVAWRNESSNAHRQYQQAVFTQAQIYVEACYNKSEDLPQCNLYTQRSLPIARAEDAACPFPGLCVDDMPALQLDTGLLDTNEMLGINEPTNMGVQMQRVTTCAPLNASQFLVARPNPPELLKKWSRRDAMPWEYIFEWFMGRLTATAVPWNSSVFVSNYTSLFSTGYDLTPRAYYAPVAADPSRHWHQSTFTPLPIFRNATADTHILGIQNNGVAFFTPNEDPLFAAHQPKSVLFDNNSTLTMYTGDQLATFLACTEQFKFCFSEGNCTDLLGVDQAYYDAQNMAPTPEQNTTLRYLFALTPTWYTLTVSPMQVTKNAISFQLGVPADQWKREMIAWYNFLLSVTQSTITHIAAGPGIAGTGFDALSEPLDSPSLCSAQRMRAPEGFSNVSVLGLALVVALSGAAMVAKMSAVPVLKALNEYDPRYVPWIKSWREVGLLQVQKRAYEGVGYSSWSKDDSSVPVVLGDVLLPDLSARSDSTVLNALLARAGGEHSREVHQVVRSSTAPAR